MTTPYYEDDLVQLHHGDCLDVLRSLPDASVDSIVTDPPYGLGFMGREWDALPPGLPWAQECLRVLKPGGHLLAFGGTRTWHRLAVAVEDAGFEVRDSIAWMYGSGFPKSLDVSKSIDKAAGAEREVVGKADRKSGPGRHMTALAGGYGESVTPDITAPATPDAERWQGWGTALKPAFEPIVVARKPLAGTVAANVLAHGTGALNIDGCRVGDEVLTPVVRGVSKLGTFEGADGNVTAERTGRWPANVILDESQAAELDKQSAGTRASLPARSGPAGTGGDVYGGLTRPEAHNYDDSGGASRFFYVAKADAAERVRIDGIAHPTVKPLALMRWLVRLVTPPGGTVLEPFAGSGTTVEACLLENFRCIAIERETDYLPLVVQRINRRRDPVAAVRATGDDMGLFDLIGGDGA